MSTDDDPRAPIRAAEVAVADGEFDIAEDALLEGLSRVRQRKAEVDDGE